jgi:hypothetical protein
MMSKNTDKAQKTIKAEKTDVRLGDISLDVFQVPDGEYRLSKTQILEVIDVKKNWLSRLPSHTPNAFKHLQDRGFTGCPIRVEFKIERGSSRADTLSISDAMRVWGYFSRNGNAIASDVLEAAGIEAIERRADKAFGVKRTEVEYNERFAVRMDLKTTKYKLFSSAIAQWQRKQGIYKTEEGAKSFKNAHDQMNLRIQDLRSRQIKESNNLPYSSLIRDFFDVSVIVDYSSVSQLSANFLRSGMAKDPVEAVNKACDCYLPYGYTAKPCKLIEDINKINRRRNNTDRKAS